MFSKRYGLMTSVALATMMAAPVVLAQQTTSTVGGRVTSSDGAAVTDATVSITDTRTGRVQTSSTNSQGAFSFSSLVVGGPYTLRISAPSYSDQRITDIRADLSSDVSVPVILSPATATNDEIIVTATALRLSNVALGPSSSFDLQDLTNLPSTSRQIRDIIRVDPRVTIGRSQQDPSAGRGTGISCLGSSNRTNSFTIDGVRANDGFGLNTSGNLARNTFPIPFDSLAAAAVEFSPVDVEYGQFSGCNINVVTKSGTNEFHGSGFFLYNNDSLTGNSVEGVEFDQGSFDRYNWGAEIGGPVIKDKLFFYGSYEETDTAAVSSVGPAGSGFPIETTLTSAETDQIRNILINSYGRDPGELIRNLPQTSRRIFGRVDWNINEDHRLEATYARLNEETIIGDDINSGRGGFTFSDNFHRRGSMSQTYGLRIFSNWTDKLSTEFRVSRQDVDDLQDPFGGGEAQLDNIPRIAVSSGFFTGGPGEFFGQDFVSGPGTFRSANQLNYTTDQLKFKADYSTGNHLFTAGYELERVDVFNLFIINATGTVFFSNIADLAAGNASNIRAGVSFTQDPSDAAAQYKRTVHTLYAQDKWSVTNNLEVVLGLRYDFYKSGSAPLENPNFIARYGFSNTQAFDGLDALQPRIGLNYTLPERFGDTRVSAGFAAFSGGDPSVWFANSFQNFGGALGVGDALTSCNPADLMVLSGGSFGGIPQCVLDGGQAQALNFNGNVAATDPNFKIPTIHRYSGNLSHRTDFSSAFLSDWDLRFDVIYSDLLNAVDFVDLRLNQNGTAPDGRPLFETVDPLAAGCVATFNGIRQGYSGDTTNCGGSPQAILLTNTLNGGGYTFSLSAQAAKDFQLSDRTSLSLNLGYAYNESVIGNAGSLFTADENFREVPTSDFNNVPLGQSPRNVTNNFVLSSTLSHEFMTDYPTSLTAFFRYRSGTSLSPTFEQPRFGDPSNRARSLLYIPDGPSDPLVTFAPGFDQAAFFNFIEENGLDEFAGGIAGKSSIRQDSAFDLDLRFQQDFPGFFGSDRFKFFVDLENFLNFISDDFGVNRFINTSGTLETVPLVDASIVGNQYVYNSFTAPTVVQDLNDTLWRIQLGVRYEF
jgi:outer membrane receptor for ferrienterochelin and colicin